MGRGRKTSEGPCGGVVSGSKGISDLEEKAKQEQHELMGALIGTLHHFGGWFFPPICPRHGPPESPQNYLSSCQSGLRRDCDVSVSTQSETADRTLAP